MSGPIKTTDITQDAYEAVTYETGTEEGLWPERIAEIANGLIKAGIVSPPVEINCNDDGTPFRDEFGRVFLRPAGQESTMPGPWLHWRGER